MMKRLNSITELKISVAMATYNGMKYIEDQINSIIQQTLLPTEIVVSDDDSSDKTLDLIRNICIPSYINLRILPSDGRLGYIKNFEKVLRSCVGDVIFLCDQDDIWRFDKIERIMNVMKDSLMIHTDARLIDSQGRVFAESYSKKSKKNPFYAPFARILDDNCVTGCTSAISRKLLECSPSFPEVISHDHWLALLAADRHGLKYLPEKLIDYRQHKDNVKGAGSKKRETLFSFSSDIESGRVKYSRKYQNLIDLKFAMEGILSESSDRGLSQYIAYNKAMAFSASGWECAIMHLKCFKYINYRDPVIRRIFKLLLTLMFPKCIGGSIS